ncbi:MAG: hypothetical protein MPW15_18455 [Candidatus Manganitrophus sp.]|nr:hypothetical protein [Candidatus Manganitrophus sp.]
MKNKALPTYGDPMVQKMIETFFDGNEAARVYADECRKEVAGLSSSTTSRSAA